MLYNKKSCNLCKSDCGTSRLSLALISALAGSALTASIFLIKKMKCRCGSLKQALCNCRDYSDSDNSYENFCECDGDPCDHERARNGFNCHAEECDTDILHSHGCLGYPHDNYEGFADSNGDRPNDLSSPEINNQKGIPEGNSSPYWAKNAEGKSNPQPENNINKVKKK